MLTRRRFLQTTASAAAVASLVPLLPRMAWAAQSDKVLQRAIPATGEFLPAIGLGTSVTFNVASTDASLEPLVQVMKTFFQGGGRLIDTAPSYGRAEEVTGDLIERAGALGKGFLATKISADGRANGMAQVQASMKALKADRLDLVQVHNLQDTATQLALLRELKAQGKVRYIGITHYVNQAHQAVLDTLKKEKVDFLQINYSIAEPEAANTLLPWCADHGVATLINRPFQRKGLLENVQGRPLPDWAREVGAGSWAQLALKWVLADTAVTAVIPATSQVKYMLDNLQAGRGELPDADLRRRIGEAFR